MHLSRSLACSVIAVSCIAGAARADIAGSFVLANSTIDVFLTDTNGFVNSFGQQTLDLVGGVLNQSGDSVETANATAFRFAGTTTGGVDDPTRRSSAELAGTFAGGGSLSLDLFSELRLLDSGSGSIAAVVVFDILIDSGEPAQYSIASLGGQFGQLQAITGSILPGNLLTSGRYAVAFNTEDAFSGTWSLNVVPAPSAVFTLAFGLIVGKRRRR